MEEKKVDKVDNLVDDAKDAASAGHSTENQLSNNLISVTLSFVALIATAISVSNILYIISFSQKVLIIVSMCLFTVSIIIGLINYFLNMTFHQESAQTSRRKAQAVKLSKVDTASVSRQSLTARPDAANTRNNAMILVQMFLLIAGLICCVVFIGTLLFITGTE